MMKSRELLYLESELTSLCGRKVSLTQSQPETLRLVLEPVGDRGRLELFAFVANNKWTVSDRGVNAETYGAQLAFIVDKLNEFGTPVLHDGDALVADTRDLSFVESVAQFVSNMEFIPVLAGLWAEEPATAAA